MKYPTWKIEIKMTLGKEKTKFSGQVDLGKDVRTVLMDMHTVREGAIEAINTAYESILVSSAKDMAARKVKKGKK